MFESNFLIEGALGCLGSTFELQNSVGFSAEASQSADIMPNCSVFRGVPDTILLVTKFLFAGYTAAQHYVYWGHVKNCLCYRVGAKVRQK